MEITYELVRQLFDYDPEGHLIWKLSVHNDLVGKRAGGTYAYKGYRQVTFERGGKRKRALVHRLIFLWHHGYLPVFPNTLDHANRNKLDNRIENLRVATPTEQNANKLVDPRSATKFKGVEYDKPRNRYRAIATRNGVKYRSKRFKTPEEAHAAYKKLAEQVFGNFACSG